MGAVLSKGPTALTWTEDREEEWCAHPKIRAFRAQALRLEAEEAAAPR